MYLHNIYIYIYIYIYICCLRKTENDSSRQVIDLLNGNWTWMGNVVWFVDGRGWGGVWFEDGVDREGVRSWLGVYGEWRMDVLDESRMEETSN